MCLQTLMGAITQHTIHLHTVQRESTNAEQHTEEILMRLAQLVSCIAQAAQHKRFVYAELNRTNLLHTFISESQVRNMTIINDPYHMGHMIRISFVTFFRYLCRVFFPFFL